MNNIPDNPFDDDKLREECGVFGIFDITSSKSDAAANVALGLHALQHRGQEAGGIVSFDGSQFYVHRALGLISDNFSSEAIMSKLKGNVAIGHTRYSTTGETLLRNVQPLFGEFSFGGFAVAHNGNLTNAMLLRRQLIQRGSLFQATSDTEVIIHLMALSSAKTIEERLIDALRQVQGAYSLVCLSDSAIIGVRDPLGVRPLVLGKKDNSYILASETCALDIIGADLIRDIEPGEIIFITREGLRSIKPFDHKKERFCIFEYVYFARPDSTINAKNVYGVRKHIGMELAKEAPVEADVVVAVPDSGVPASMGYSLASGLPFELGIIRNHYVGRTFIEPSDHVRHLGVKLKHNANSSVLKGKRVILVDDSIVRGTTSRKIVTMVREAGATEVHMRIASPPTTNSCYYGVDTPERSQLMAAQHSVKEMANLIGVDSLAFISIDGLYRALGEARRNDEMPQYCDACFTNDYPIELTDYKQESSMGSKENFGKLAEV